MNQLTERPLKQKTVDLHQDQIAEIERLSGLSGMKISVVLRKALDIGLGLPKAVKEKESNNED